MNTQFVPSELLQKTDKVLFVAHLAIGDFTYMEACFKAFHQAYPHIQIDIWVDEVRRTYDFRQWQGLKKYSLFDWLDAVPYFGTIYKETYSPFVMLRSLLRARSQRYALVVSFGLSHRTFYARLIRWISGNGFLAAIENRYKPPRRYRPPNIFKQWVFARLNARLPERPKDAEHVSEVYAGWFRQLFGLDISQIDRFPSLAIPSVWRDDATRRLQQWGIPGKDRRQSRLIFVNPVSKQDVRCWTVQKALELIDEMRKLEHWSESDFILNTVPEQWDETKAILESHPLRSKVRLFSATDNFFQLPAILSQCDLIISVETAVMHLANAVGVPVIALMRQHTPEWMPIDTKNSRVVMTLEYDDCVQDISLSRVIEMLPNAANMTW